MRHARGLFATLLIAAIIVAWALPGAAAPEGQMTWAVHVSLAPTWFDPAETSGIITPFLFLYALHDALVKPMPGTLMAPGLAESWTVSADQRVYEFKLREGVKFHNGDPFTAEDVKFSFHRAKGARILHDKVREIEVAGPARVRFHLINPYPWSAPLEEVRLKKN